MEVEGVATANLSWDLSKGPVPPPLQNKLVDHCLLELLQYANGSNHAILRLVFKHPQVGASSRAPANTQGVRMELEVQDEAGTGPVEGQLVFKTFTYTGTHRNAAVSHMLPVKGQKAVRHFINIAQKVKLTPCDFNSLNSDTVGCRDFLSQFIYHLDRGNVLKLPNDKATSVYDLFNWKYSLSGATRVPTVIYYAAFNQNYQHVNIPGCVYPAAAGAGAAGAAGG
ncbi:hypothetical protein N7453_005877 [Penicillium expansum]|nr:hypothetical protein N7453_005877 [Penicillium expansum]